MPSPLRLRRHATDADLIARGDSAGFAELFSRHAVAVHGWLAQRLPWAASDLTGETFARALLQRDRFRDDRDGSALPWLLGIARNLLADTVRDERIETRARERLGLPTDLAGDEDAFQDVENRLSPRLALKRQLAALPPGVHEALKLRVEDHLDYHEIAGRLAIQPNAAQLRVSRGLRRLAHTVPKEDS
jgi:RNA polymerase sigma factor (sigma-70 family)